MKYVPNGLMALGGAVVLGVAAGASPVQRWSLFAAIVLAGVGYFWDKLAVAR
jgi:hypothetical protein